MWLWGDVAGAMGTASRVDIHVHAALGAAMNRFRLLLIDVTIHLLHRLDDTEENDRDDNEVDECGDYCSDIERDIKQGDGIRVEIDATGYFPDYRHEEVGDERVDQCGKRATYHHTDRQIDDVSSRDESFEFLEELFHVDSLLCGTPYGKRIHVFVKKSLRVGHADYADA